MSNTSTWAKVLVGECPSKNSIVITQNWQFGATKRSVSKKSALKFFLFFTFLRFTALNIDVRVTVWFQGKITLGTRHGAVYDGLFLLNRRDLS